MTARGVDFLLGWIASNLAAESNDAADAGMLAAKLVAEAAVAGFMASRSAKHTKAEVIYTTIMHFKMPCVGISSEAGLPNVVVSRSMNV